MNMIDTAPNVHHGLTVKSLRLWLGVKQTELGEAIELEQSQVSDLEKKPVIPPTTLKKIADFFKVDVKFFDTFSPAGLLKRIGFEHIELNNTDRSNAVVMGNYEDKSLPFSEFKKCINEMREQDKLIADMRVFLAENGLKYDPSKN